METKKWGKAILSGLIAIFSAAVAISLIFSLLLKFTGMTERSIQWMLLALSFITLFIGGFIAGGKGKEKGWLLGGMTALCYTLIILLFQFLGFGSALKPMQFLYHAGFLAIAMLGGMIGVNMSSDR
ncbi:TIGR04086 family membrane protein [Bacillus sp. FJAT-42376]|uniref:TIGR04086 family membrane protein n=1 Tax=Bacillus sp. FJAT-42376 TaxID=2014076 RepID=UPI000F4D4CDF|nr:TIGR04086 family membrane protein [Bacillus sp. FJAT-42376]AZB43765.1 TIGR04086 family membrane protein [Bacillus sp. FJAT-42376]